MTTNACFATSSWVTLGKTSEKAALFTNMHLKRDLRHLSNTSAHLVWTGGAKKQHVFLGLL